MVRIKIVFIGGAETAIRADSSKYAEKVIAALAKDGNVSGPGFVVRAEHVMWAEIKEDE
jgi:hypothetical protein